MIYLDSVISNPNFVPNKDSTERWTDVSIISGCLPDILEEKIMEGKTNPEKNLVPGTNVLAPVL